jgi:hypothetical protein
MEVFGFQKEKIDAIGFSGENISELKKITDLIGDFD